jgi:hypothetical protein
MLRLLPPSTRVRPPQAILHRPFNPIDLHAEESLAQLRGELNYIAQNKKVLTQIAP